MKRNDSMNIKKYVGTAMALVIASSNVAAAAEIDEAALNEDQLKEIDFIDHNTEENDYHVKELAEPKLEDTYDIINPKEAEDDESAKVDNFKEDNSKDMNEDVQADSDEDNTEISTDSQEDINTEDIQLNFSEIENKPLKGDGVEELKGIELTEEETSDIPKYNPIDELEKYNAYSDAFNYSYTKGRDSLANLSNGSTLQSIYDKTLDYLNKIHNGSIELIVTDKENSYYLERIDVSSFNCTKNDLLKVLLTIRYDHPEMFWIGDAFISTNVSNKITDFAIKIQSQFKDIREIKAAKKKLDNAVAEYFDSAAGLTSDYDIEKAFHDKMIRESMYDPYVNNSSYINVNSHNVLGVLVDKVGVCESYAKAMQLLLNAKGIDNLYVTGNGGGEGHAWNQVNINGVYCNLDVTWDDLNTIEGGGISYNYFNVKDSDFTTHKANNPSCSSGSHDYLYAVQQCTSDEYTWFNQNKDNVLSSSDSDDNEKIKAYLIKNIKESLEKDDYTISVIGEDYSTANKILNYYKKNINDIIFSDELKSLFTSKCSTSGIKYGAPQIGNRQFDLSFTPLSKVEASSISIPDKITITTLKNSKYLMPIVMPDTTNETITWQSSNRIVAMMDSKGKGVVVPLKTGKATITATIGNVSAQCEVTVESPVYVDSDKNELQNLYDDNKDRIQSKYTEDSWNNFKTALDNAKAALDDDNAEQEEVYNAKIALKDAIDSLVELGDKTELQKLYDENKDKQQGSYSNKTWNTFINALRNAQTVLNKSEANQTEVDNAYNVLKNSIANLTTNSSSGGHSGGGSSSSGGHSSGNSSHESSSSSKEIKSSEKMVITINGKKISDVEENINKEEKDKEENSIKDTIRGLLKDFEGLTDSNFSNINKFTDEDFEGSLVKFIKENKNYIYINCANLISDSKDININGAFESINKYIYRIDKLTRKLIYQDNINEEDSNENSLVMNLNSNSEYIVADAPLDSLKNNSWNKVDNKWMYVKDSNVKTGWFKDTDNKWYYTDSKGIMQTGWIKDTSGDWYSLSQSGFMITGWFKDTDGRYYYLNSDGRMRKGWFKDNDGNWYHLGENGAMTVGWFKDTDGKWYYLNSNGSMARNTIINGYNIGNDGSWF